MATLYYLNQFFTTTLNVGGGIDNSQTTGIVLTSVSGIDTSKPGIALLSYADPLNTANAEWVTYTSIDGSNELQGVTRGAEGFSAKAHANGVAVAFPLSESHINNIVGKLNGVDSGVTLTTPTFQTRWVAKGEYDNGNSGTSKAISWANGDRQVVTMTGNCTFTYSNAAAGQTLTLRLIEDGTGGYSVTLPTSKWPGGAAGTFTTTANAINLLIVYFDGTNYLTQLAAGFA